MVTLSSPLFLFSTFPWRVEWSLPWFAADVLFSWCPAVYRFGFSLLELKLLRLPKFASSGSGQKFCSRHIFKQISCCFREGFYGHQLFSPVFASATFLGKLWNVRPLFCLILAVEFTIAQCVASPILKFKRFHPNLSKHALAPGSGSYCVQE